MISNSREKTTIQQARVRAEIVTEELQRLIGEAQPLPLPTTSTVPSRAPVVLPSPPRTIIISSWKVSIKSNSPGEMVVSREASRPPPIPSEEGAGGEGAGFNAEGVDPHGDRRIFIVANSFHHPAILRPHQLEDHAGGQQGEQPAPEQGDAAAAEYRSARWRCW